MLCRRVGREESGRGDLEGERGAGPAGAAGGGGSCICVSEKRERACAKGRQTGRVRQQVKEAERG